ncbi:MAG: hypothetical protein ACON34_03655 [Flavobacteriales bacterium]
MDISTGLKKFNCEELPENFVSVAVQLDSSRTPFHSGIIIRLKRVEYLHHFDGNPPEVKPLSEGSEWYVYKMISEISTDDPEEVGAFLQFCKNICAKSRISYSFIADCSSYNNRGEFITRLGLPELGTCVGFCVNTLANTLIDVDSLYFNLDDWDDSGLDDFVASWYDKQVAGEYPDLDWNLYNAFRKRISPMEYLCSGFLSDYPISKSAVDDIKEDVQNGIEALFPDENSGIQAAS